MGLFTPQGPPEWHPAPSEVQKAAKEAAQIAAKRGCSLPKLALMDALQNEDIATTLVGLCSVAQVNENCDATLQGLGLMESPNKEDEVEALEKIKEVLTPVMDVTWPSGRPENN